MKIITRQIRTSPTGIVEVTGPEEEVERHIRFIEAHRDDQFFRPALDALLKHSIADEFIQE